MKKYESLSSTGANSTHNHGPIWHLSFLPSFLITSFLTTFATRIPKSFPKLSFPKFFIYTLQKSIHKKFPKNFSSSLTQPTTLVTISTTCHARQLLIPALITSKKIFESLTFTPSPPFPSSPIPSPPSSLSC